MAVLAGLAVPAAADPRDQVLDRAARCSALADSRQWLNCFYGSAQPMRAWLGLPPAPAAQTALVPAGAAAPQAFVPQSAAPSAMPIQPMPAQSMPARPMPVQQMPAPSRVASAPASQPDLAPAPPPMPQERGFFDDLIGEGRPVVRNMPMTDYKFGYDGAFTVTLQDGQVWQQSRNPSSKAQWSGPAENYRVTIVPGVLGTYNLSVAGAHGFYKVSRIR